MTTRAYSRRVHQFLLNVDDRATNLLLFTSLTRTKEVDQYITVLTYRSHSSFLEHVQRHTPRFFGDFISFHIAPSEVIQRPKQIASLPSVLFWRTQKEICCKRVRIPIHKSETSIQ